MVKAYVPDAGDLVWLTFEAGRRPALVISPRRYNEPAGLAVMCPITSKPKGYRFEVALPAESQMQGVVLTDHIKSLDWRARKATFISVSEPSMMDEVRARLRPLLGLD